MQYLTLDEVIFIHEETIRRYGGASIELRDAGALDSALASPQQVVFDTELYPTLCDKAAILWFLLIKNHPFVDGNKRTGLLGLLRFIERNGFLLQVTNDEAFDLTIAVATGGIEKDDIPLWIEPRLRPKD